MRLTKRAVDGLEAQAKRYIAWDEDLAGFGVRVEPSGRKVFIARYRAGGGRSGTLRQVAIGRLGVVTPDEARASAKKTLAAATTGADPLEEKRQARKLGVTVADICDWYLKEAEGGRLLGRRGRPIKKSTLATDRNRISSHVVPLLGGLAVTSLSLGDIEQMQADISARKTARQLVPGEKHPRGGVAKGGAGTAGRTLGMLRTIFEHALRRGMISANPARGARRVADKKRTVRLSLDQLHSLGEGLKRAAAVESPTALAAIKLIALTGLRKGEALGIRKGWLLREGGLNFPDTKSDAQVRPIGRVAIDLLDGRFARARSDWAFPSDRGLSHFVGLGRVFKRVCALASLDGVTPHTLRHTYASVAAELGYSELVIAGLLGHAAGSVTRGYIHLDRALTAAADHVCKSIAAAIDGVGAANAKRAE